MYAVVGCNECGTRWLLSDPDEADSAQCPRCGKRHRTRKLKRFYQSEDRDAARQVRAAILAERSGHKDAFDDLESVAEMEARVADAGVDDEEYLTGSGLDADEVTEAGERATSRHTGGGSRSRPDVVRDALREADRPTESDVVDYAVEAGVPAEAARDVLDRLTRRGEVTESRGVYRLL
jgi:DNA-directed RNA polymerase subunit RPC12/RpoP